MRFFTVIGVWFMLMFALGTFDIIDFHVCVKGPGECGRHETK